MAPIRHAAPRKVSVISFVLVNLWIDQPAITNWFMGLPLPSHAGYDHSFVLATLLAVIVAIPGVGFPSWVLGSFLGAISHILLDALVHPEAEPFYPVILGNPLYMGWMEPLSWVLLPMTVWFIALCVSDTLGWVRKHWAAWKARTEGASVCGQR